MSTPEIPSFSQMPQRSSSSFPQTLKLPSLRNPAPLLPPPISDSSDDNFPENPEKLLNLQVMPNGFRSSLTKESGDRVFIQDPPWISSLFMKSLLFRGRNRSGVKIEFKEMERRKYYLLRRRQIKAETEAWENTVEEYRKLEREMCERKLAPNLPHVKKLMLGWFEPLTEAIEKEQNVQRSKKNKAAFAPYVDALPADKMAVIVMHKIMGLLMMGGKEDRCVRVVEAAVQIGVAIEHEVRIHSFLERTKKHQRMEVGAESLEDSSKEAAILRKRVKSLIKRNRVIEVQKLVRSEEFKSWGRDTQAKLGCCLIQLLTQSAYVQPPVNQSADSPPDVRPAFRHIFKIATRESGQSLVKKYGVIECDPLVLAGLDKTALDTLGNTKWRVNKRILSVVESIWAAGGNLAGLVNREDVPIPELLSDDVKEVKKWKWSVRKVKKINQERHSQRCDTELKLSVARKMKDEEGFYYPHNLDFRGRAYPMHPHLNHLSSDLCRGILEFAEGRPLGKSGLRWLKIHLANLYGGGVEKLSYDGRISFVENYIAEIFDSADNSLNGNRWWLKAEDPFQCLAACINLSEALRSSSPHTVVSHLPIHQFEAAAVNLIAGDKPADVYSEIAERVHNIMKRDSEKDPATDPSALLAKLLIGQVDRKLVKQTVMTSVYGVTYVGAREQIKRRLEEKGLITDDRLLFSAACYAAKVTLAALGELFQAARAIMGWLGDCAKVEVRKQRTAFPPNFVHSLDGSHMMMTAIACRDAGLRFAGLSSSPLPLNPFLEELIILG
ncbi:hypothetical protein DH2020_010884 [Rehmannia glutinosa]|uniref:DNA-directed RNA polymerase n=1 Tax=Rehmannia glutinosa TaxID=99300 RepID=A0ABR0XBY4_REHGL